MTTLAVKLRSSAETEIRTHAERTFPEECCGILLGTDFPRTVHSIISIDNTKDENRKRRYLIDPKALLTAERDAARLGVDVVGIYHSHPNHPSKASEFDREHAMPHWSYVIISCMEGKSTSMQSWRLRDDRSVFDEEELSID